ncbi:MAG TPA: clostripain-related cysteine peptidase, partial [Flavobacteriales bacterium]|nr:clostripain-related cysteine peptidase [Flavobacteriales bacterium]
RKVIQRKEETDTGSPAALTDFLNYGLKRYPSEKKIAVVWSHGSGFKAVTRDIGYDDTSGNSMDMPEIVFALGKAGINERNKLDIIGFDACLMAMLEVAHHLRKHAKILVGSQQTEPGNGWPYDKILKHLKHNPEPEKIVRHIVTEYKNFYRKKRKADVTQSAINLANTGAAVNALNDLGNYMCKNMATANGSGEVKVKTVLAQCRIAAQNFDFTDYIDVVDFCQLVLKRVYGRYPELDALLLKLIDKCKACIIHQEYYGNGVNRSNGLSIWFPGSREVYYLNRAKYLKLDCNQYNKGWSQFLDQFYND